MPNRLNIKLLLPVIFVGILVIIVVAMLDGPIDKSVIISLLVALLVAQTVASYFYSEKLLSARLSEFKHYLALVVSTKEAPSKPLVDSANDDLSLVMNEMGAFVANLSDVIAEIKAESDALKQGSVSLTTQMTNSSASVEQASNEIEQMANSLEQVASTSMTLSDSAQQVSDTTNQVLSILEQGTNASTTSQSTIEQFAGEVTEMATDLALLQEECAHIGTVLDVIRSIADQTNLLALNAAIEAARAGEQGRGFAVVADEVRALAHRTQESTVEIQSMVEGLQAKSNNAVDAISRGQVLSQDSLSHSAQVVEALEQIGQMFTEVDTLTSQIASGTNEQQHATGTINDNMSTVVTLSRDINLGLNAATEHATTQQETAAQVDTTLSRICV